MPHLVHSEKHLVLWYEGILGLCENTDEHAFVEGVEGNQRREPTNKLGDHSKFCKMHHQDYEKHVKKTLSST